SQGCARRRSAVQSWTACAWEMAWVDGHAVPEEKSLQTAGVQKRKQLEASGLNKNRQKTLAHNACTGRVSRQGVRGGAHAVARRVPGLRGPGCKGRATRQSGHIWVT